MPERDVELILKRLNVLKSQRRNWDTHWDEVAEIVWPEAHEFLERREVGEKRSEKMFDATAALALEKFAAVLTSFLIPRNQRWHTLRASDDQLNKVTEVKEWFEEATRILFVLRNSPRADYYSQRHEGFKSLGAFGNDCLRVDEAEEGGIRYLYRHLRGIFIETDPFNKIDTVYDEFELTAKAAEQKWGAENLPEKTKQDLEDDPFKTRKYVHLVLPRPADEFDPEKLTDEGKPFLSLEVAVDDKAIITEGGFHENPFMFARYTVNPREKYGRGPAMLVLPTIKMVQEMQRTFIRSGQMVVAPPILAVDDGAIGYGANSIGLRPDEINYGTLDPTTLEPLMKPFNTGARLDLTEGMLEKEREVINDALLVTLFQILVDTPNMTATEVLQRAQEKGQLLAPTVGRQQSEMLGPQIERELSIAQRQGLLPELPEALIEANGEYEIEYEGPAARFQRSEELVGIQQTVELAAPFVQADPKLMLMFDGEEVIRLTTEVTGAPTKILKSPEEFAEALEAANQAEAAAQLAAAAPGIAGMGKTAAETQEIQGRIGNVPA